MEWKGREERAEKGTYLDEGERREEKRKRKRTGGEAVFKQSLKGLWGFAASSLGVSTGKA